MRKILLIIAIILSFALQANADTGFVFKGKIGNYPIVMTIWATIGSASGNYYYVSQGKNKKLDLWGEPDLDCEEDDIWFLKESVNGVPNGYFRVKWDRSNPGIMYGYYLNKKGRMYNVRLQCVEVNSNPEHC